MQQEKWTAAVETARSWAGRQIRVHRIETDQPLVALTFDDGPDPEVTPAVLDVLAEHGAHATFFVLTPRALRHPEIVARILAEGHEVGLHGIDHRRLTHLVPNPRQVGPWARAAVSMARRQRAGRVQLRGLTGAAPRWWRPAYGTAGGVGHIAARALGMTAVLWSVSVIDWRPAAPEERLSELAGVRAGDIVLAHDGRAGAEDGAIEPADLLDFELDKPALLRRTLTLLAERGLRCVTVGELAAARASR